MLNQTYSDSGSCGGVTKGTPRADELPEFFGWALGKVKAQSDTAIRRLVDRFVGFYSDNLFNPHPGKGVRFKSTHSLSLEILRNMAHRCNRPMTWGLPLK